MLLLSLFSECLFDVVRFVHSRQWYRGSTGVDGLISVLRIWEVVREVAKLAIHSTVQLFGLNKFDSHQHRSYKNNSMKIDRNSVVVWKQKAKPSE